MSCVSFYKKKKDYNTETHPACAGWSHDDPIAEGISYDGFKEHMVLRSPCLSQKTLCLVFEVFFDGRNKGWRVLCQAL
jgi:hypothetical protein